MTIGNERIERRLIKGREAIINALETPDILRVLTGYSYGETRLNVGLGLYKDAYRFYGEQQRRYGEQYRASEILTGILEEARERYNEFRRLSRVALRKSKPLMVILGVEERSKRTLGGWMEEARQFYTNAPANPRIMEKLSNVGITAEDLEAGKRMVDRVEKAAADHEMKKGKARQATKQRNIAYKMFMEWMKDFRQVCRVAFARTPQKLEKLGMKAKS
jgi:hypothetical protein